MSDIKTLHKTARTLILNLRDGLEQLERSENVRNLRNAALHATNRIFNCLNWLKRHRHRTMLLQLVYHDSCNRSYRTCKKSALRWRASGACKLSKKAQQKGTSGNGRHVRMTSRAAQVQQLKPSACRKVEQVSEETDALRMALDKHTGRQHR